MKYHIKEHSGRCDTTVLAEKEKNHCILFTMTSIIEKNQFI
jgi:hypothetical protein